MTVSSYLILAHLLLDYPLQGDFMAKTKASNNFILFAHSLLWGLGMCAVLDHFHLYQDWMLHWMVWGHMAMDWIKCHKLSSWMRRLFSATRGNWKIDPLGLPLWIDQTWHVFQIVVCLWGFVMTSPELQIF